MIQVFEFELRSELNSLERNIHIKGWIPSESSHGAWRLEMSLEISAVFYEQPHVASQASVLYPFPQTRQLYLLALTALVAGCNKTNKRLQVSRYWWCACVKMKGRASVRVHHKGIIKPSVNQTYTDLSARLIRQAERREASCSKTKWTDIVSF